MLLTRPSDHDWYTLTPRDERGVEVVCRFDAEGRMVIQTRQYLPDDYLDMVAAIRDMQAPMFGNTQRHRRHIYSMPSALWQQIVESRGGDVIDTPYEDQQEIVDKAVLQGDYAKLRTGKA